MVAPALLALLSPLSLADTGAPDPASVCSTPAGRIARTLPQDGQLDVPRSVQPVVVLAPCPIDTERMLYLWASTASGLERVAERRIDPDPEGHGQVVAFDLPGSALAPDSSYLLEVRDPEGPAAFSGFTTGTTEETFPPPAPRLTSIRLQIDRSMRAQAFPEVLQIGGLVALFPVLNLADAPPAGTSLDALYDITLAPTTFEDVPGWQQLEIDVHVPSIDSSSEQCFVARHRTRSGRWSEPSTMRCAVPFDPSAAPLDTGFFEEPVALPGPRGCSISGSASGSPLWAGGIGTLLVFLGSFTLGLRRRG